MRKFFGLAAVLAAFAFALVFAGCSNSAGGDGNGGETPNGGIAPGSAYEEKLTISLSESEKLSAAGAAALTAGKDVSEWFASKAVSASVSDGFVGFKAEIVSATETSLVIKVTGKAGTKKCSVTLSITIPATVTASGKEVKKENVKTVGIGVEPEILQTEHVKVEKVKGGLKFTITRPSESCYDPNAVLGEVKDENGNPTYIYKYVGDNNGDYNKDLEYVGDGSGSYKKELNKIYGGWNWSYIESNDGMWADFYPCDKDSIECIYPLCEPGKRYDFTVNFQPKNVNLKEFHKFEKLSVIAENGIGEFTSLKKDGCLDMSYDGTKLILKLKNYKAPENVKNLRTVVEYFATNQSELIDGHVDWNTSYAVVYLATKSFEGAVYECEVDSFDSEGGIETALATREKDTLYAQCFFTFDVPEATGFGITGHGGFRAPSIYALKKIR